MFQKIRNLRRNVWERHIAGESVQQLKDWHDIRAVPAQKTFNGEKRWGTLTTQYGIFTPIGEDLQGLQPDD